MASRYPTSEDKTMSKPRENRRRRRVDLRTPARLSRSNSRSCSGTSSRGSLSTRPRGTTRAKSRQIASPQSSINFVALLKEIQSTELVDVISRLHDARFALGNFLGRKLESGKMELLVFSLSKLCGTEEMPEKTDEIVSLLHEQRFLEFNMTRWIADWKRKCPADDVFDRNIMSIIAILRRMLRQIPDSVSSIGATLLVLKTVSKDIDESGNHMSSEVSSNLKLLIEEHERFQRDSYEMTSRITRKDRRPPPEDFRCLPILPMPHELQEHFKPFLRANIVNGSYDSVHHYLDIHFRLLREDLIQPLRQGIADYRNALTQRKDRSQRMSRMQSISVYEEVTITGAKDSSSGIHYILHFKVKGKLERVDWELSKRLPCGSLLCLSPDNFQTLIFAVIAKREPRSLKKGIVEVTIEEMPVELLKYPLTMVESPSYFEAYKHVLHRLRNINQSKFPFLTYLVSVSTEGDLPKYVKENPQMTLNASCILEGNSEKEGSKPSHKMKKINLNNDKDWPSKEQLGFDDSQMEAYKAAFREEVCVIQGPPGTGKTFVGLKIVKTLLTNKKNWSKGEPLLVVCYTNHALDQFLEGILTFEEGVVRLGGRSTSEKVIKQNINLLIGPRTRGKIRELTSSEGPKVETDEIRECKEIIHSCAKQRLLSLHGLGKVLNLAHRQSLEHGNIQQNSNCILFWLFNCDEMYRLLYSKIKRHFHQIDDDFHRGAGYDDKSKENCNFLDEGDEDVSEKDWNVGRKHGKNGSFENQIVPDAYFIHETEYHEDKIPSYNRITRGQKIFQFVQMKLSQNDAMTRHEATRITDVWALDVRNRWRLYMHWRNSFIVRMEEGLEILKEQLEKSEAISRNRKVQDIRKAFSRFSVIGATTTGAAKHGGLLQILGPTIVVVEEAAEILEAHVITALSPSCQHLILIGDHQQLRPSPEVYKLCKQYKLDVSLFERLVQNGMPCHRLSTQHRMRPEISRVLKIHEDFYPGLLDHDMVTHYKEIRGLKTSLYFVEHAYVEEHNDDNKSRSNRHEATFVYEMYKYLLKQGYLPNQITILTAYRGQVRTFKNIMGEHFREVRVCPIDNFQGEENDIILFSFVRSNDEGNIGFLKVSNRICVALSRAKEGLYCIGNFHLMSKQNSLWKTITDDLRTRQCIGTHLQLVCRNHPDTFTDVSVADDFKKVPDGGCMQQCDARLNCGHTCPHKCHPEDREHRKIFCTKPCEKVMCELQHICPLKCGEDCGDKCNEIIEHICPNLHKRRAKCHLKSCTAKCESMLKCGHRCRMKCSEPCTEKCLEFVLKILPCGHERRFRCYLKPEEVKCPAKCNKKLTCGHNCKETCSNPCTKRCEEIVQRNFSCGHEQAVKCYIDPEKVLCQSKCDKHLSCGHPCNTLCSSPCTERCEKMVQKELSCGHLQVAKCHLNPNEVTCQSKCEKMLKCGHSCKEKCCQTCTTACKEMVTKTLTCGHIKEVACHLEPRCQVMVSKKFDLCNHVLKVECSRTSCPKPCSAQLTCGHVCRGTCGECKNGTAHVKCRKPCEKRCMHSRCKNFCGDLCQPCAKPCPWRCPHSRCSLKCSEECNRNPCSESCGKNLRCGHICAGLCGEPCPPVCRLCNKTWISWFLGRRDKHQTRFIFLLDCQHVVAENEMDKLMREFKTNGEVIKFPECPWCRTPIRYNPRYQKKLRAIWKRKELTRGQAAGHGNKTHVRAHRRSSRPRRRASSAL